MFIRTIHFSPKWLKNIAFVFLISLGATACQQIFSADIGIVKFADKSAYMADEKAIRSVDRTFYAAFHMGDWHYKGADARIGQVNAYVKIPQKLDLRGDVQEQYIQQILCPSESNLDLWFQLKHVELELHIYTQNKNRSVSATCHNPLKQNQQA